MIYTSYFANIKNLPRYATPVAICGKSPIWYKGLQYKKLAPKYDFFMQYKQDGDKEAYTKHFMEEVLDTLNPTQVVLDLLRLVGNFQGLSYTPEIVLICYEKSSDFCHRHLVAEWLNNNGHEVKEWK